MSFKTLANNPSISDLADGCRTLSIIIVTWNCRPHIEQCLRSLRGLNLEDFETIIVDNNSSDGTPEFLALIDSETRRSLNLKIIPQK
ncbi:glycosyltransferase, partial [Candidatus Bathyarchaeota archaeon]|nr:glycosyltransferase [Candidatus Bathyarchaeota archaeon]